MDKLVLNTASNICFAVEKEAFDGVKRIADKVAGDFEKVIGKLPIITDVINADTQIIFATLGQSSFVDELIASGKFNAQLIADKWEVYAIQFIDNRLIVIGSDKRGTIYGMFAISEVIGVSPLHYWGDAEPVVRDEIIFNATVATVSKEPSVKYRGFFINDEWPCYGNWTFNHFGGFTAEMYDHVFELLLRLKGNYMWPAMWTSSFPLDGPGNLNEDLADIYGVVMGKSHHEPCLRASEEWKPGTGYGDNWCYFTNKEGLNRYWEDGIKRSGKYEKITMLGMRGERDSEILGKDATLKDNIDLLKDVITNQRALLDKYGNPDNPNMLAIYKEVERYFYGDAETEGLKDWDGLDDVICMFCEDNFGFVRTLPTPELGNRRYGMYYHFDYHGGPISYEWMPSTTYERTWEQMSTAYDYGVRDVWIVNVGDLKFNEVPLQYFMDLAYDFETWGTNSPNKITTYIQQWAAKTFPTFTDELITKTSKVLHNYIRLNAMRRPEALNAAIYHPANYNETDNMLKATTQLEQLNEEVYLQLAGGVKEAYYSMIWLPTTASINLLRMHLYSAKNLHYANQGKKVANEYADLVTKAIAYDRQLFTDFAEFKGGKWRGMELEEHIGFTTWNDDNWRYPLRTTVEPVHQPRLLVSRADDARVYHKAYGHPMTVLVDDFLYNGNTEVIIEIANDGIGELDYKITGEIPEWLTLSTQGGTVQSQDNLVLICDRSKLKKEVTTAELIIEADGARVVVDIKAQADLEELPAHTHLPNNGVTVIPADGYFAETNAGAVNFVRLENYGRSGVGMKVYPTTANFNEFDLNRPSLEYRLLIEQAGEYIVEVWTTPTNPFQNNKPLRLTVNEIVATTVPADFIPYTSDDRWSAGVLDNIRKTKVDVTFDTGIQEFSVGALEAGLIIEKILVYRKDNAPKPSYLGPQATTLF